MNKQLYYAAAGIAGSFIVGFFIGKKYQDEKMTDAYLQWKADTVALYEKEIAELKGGKDILSNSKVPKSTGKTLNDIRKEVEERVSENDYQKAVEDIPTVQSIEKKLTEEEHPEEEEDSKEDDDWPLSELEEQELRDAEDSRRINAELRKAKQPKLIRMEDYGELNYLDSKTLYYYVEDDILATEEGEVLDNQEAVLGNCMTKFGFKTNPEERTIYVRNLLYGTDYEVIKNDGHFYG